MTHILPLVSRKEKALQAISSFTYFRKLVVLYIIYFLFQEYVVFEHFISNFIICMQYKVFFIFICVSFVIIKKYHNILDNVDFFISRALEKYNTTFNDAHPFLNKMQFFGQKKYLLIVHPNKSQHYVSSVGSARENVIFS